MTDIDKIIDEAKKGLLPYESWERLDGESGAAYAAFCAYRDYGPDRNIRRAVEQHFTAENRAANVGMSFKKKYQTWRQWSTRYQWRKRVTDYEKYLERMRQIEIRKTMESRSEVHRQITGKMLMVVGKKLDQMNPMDLAQGTVTEWVEAAIKADREAAGLVTPAGEVEPKQGEINFTPEFEGI
jgi:uncharacterized short protein YbdD (DUF466 family)